MVARLISFIVDALSLFVAYSYERVVVGVVVVVVNGCDGNGEGTDGLGIGA